MAIVKICGLTRLEDAMWAWECGADLLGFIFVPASRRRVAPKTAAAIISHLKDSGCLAGCVGVVANEEIETVRQIARQCRLDLVQLHGGEPPEYTQALGVPAIVARRIKDAIPWEELGAYHAWAYLLDTYHEGLLGGTGQSWSWSALADAPAEFPRVLVAGGLTPQNVHLLVEQAHPWGVDVSSGVETQPGVKDRDKVLRFVTRAKGASG